MLKRLLFSVGFSLVFGIGLFAQSGTLQGVITDKSTNEPIPFANVVAMVSGLQKGGSTTDFDGNYTIKPLEPGVYDLVVSYVGYHTQPVSNVRVIADQIMFVNVQLVPETIDIGVVEIIEYEVPLIQKDKTQSGGTITSEEIDKMPERSIAAVATTVGGVFSRDGEVGSIRGQRSEGTVYYIDGIRVTGSTSLPQSAYDQISVILGGVPAQYGDVTGGVVSITTKGPSREFGMGVEYQTSGFGEKKGLDPYGYNRIDVNLTGPLIKSKNPNDPSSILGYFLSFDATYQTDGARKMNGVNVATDEYLDYLLANPFRLTDAGTGVWHNANFITENDLYKRKSTPNTPSFSAGASGKIDIRTTPNMNLSIGGNYNYYNYRGYNYASSMFNYMNNAQHKGQTWRVYGRLFHRFKTSEESALQNVFYQLQFDYTRVTATSQDPIHKDNLFDYGYVGKYETTRYRQYEEGASVIVNIDGEERLLTGVKLFSGYVDSLITFNRGEKNPYLANYMDNYYKLFPTSRGDEVNYYTNTNDILAAGGFLNGGSPSSIYSLFTAPGALQSSYSETFNQQFGVAFRLNADIKKHALQFGFQFEQRINSYYSVGAQSFWQFMRQFSNTHISELDLENPILLYEDGVFLNQVDYNYLYNESSQFKIDKSLRNLLGIPVDGTEWIDTDSYDPVNNTMNYYDEQGNYIVKQLNGNLDISMFSTDELLDNELVGYRGYDAYGNRIKGTYSVEDFLSEKDSEGYFTRPIGASRPVYGAIYLQDIFSFRDLIFNVGVRVDRYDANQSVLKDPYLLFEANTVGDIKSNPGVYDDFVNSLPGNMGDDYVVYVDDVNEPNSIMGFRNGNTWYDANGIYITDPESVLDAGKGIAPYLKDPNNTSAINANVFTDYKPQYSVMPRIAFSFPISDEALFFAHYDILTQRPTSYATLYISDYYYMPSKSSGTSPVNNPNLKPETTIEYEIGFQQRLTATSALSLSAFYRELRDQIQIYRFTGAYPRTYYSFENLDFGTIKGLTVSYDLRRTKNVRLRASYTLQFANGTGSDPTATQAIVTSGQPNLRTLTPTNDDQRHRITLNLDYRFGEGKKYNGPTTKRINKKGEEKTTYWLQNTGLNVSFQGGTGTPYTKAKEAYSLVDGQRIIDGSINGSRMAAFFRCDLRLDRDFNISSKDSNKAHYLNVYLQVLNVFNSKNVLSVYSYTGNPDNDGYLTDGRFENLIKQQLSEASYRLLYSLRCDNPGNYAGPRVIRLGVSYNF
ncbi:TonB-dependent receptor [Bacteroidales bacterium OttesenSCG-928-K03]|nr:TonB-dependent receptor [Odoribacter sp. OttesenSCG-928-L07]MDL2239013.1 TonB-dependent receptor [Bacteroidales bacterium OttesenSCG-928-L14]MDL2242149.1 TonB-dependent receptor [Bacteroidales bacterium OttesenSCG-928-K03]